MTIRLKVECSTAELMTRVRTRRDSNPQPSVPKTDALSIALRMLNLLGLDLN